MDIGKIKMLSVRKPILYCGIMDNLDYLIEKRVDLENMIACGGIGCVFPLVGIHDAVAKITPSLLEFEFSKFSSKNKKSIFPKVYLVEAMPKKACYASESRKVYLTIRENVMPFTVIDRDVENEFSKELDLAADEYATCIPNKVEELEESIKKFKDPRVINFLKDLLFFMKKKIIFDDVTYDNIGLSYQNEIKIYDAFIE